MPYIPRQYESSRPFLKSYNNLGNIVNTDDAMRVNCYNLFDDFYYNRKEFFKVTTRGDSDVEIYLPSVKQIVDSTARYLAVDFGYNIKGESADAAKTLMDKLFLREEIQRKIIRGKKSYLTRGDMVWYITADDRKEKGERVSINTIHPSCVFPIEDPENAHRVIGWHIIDLVHDPRDKANDHPDKMIARRQTYRKNGKQITTEAMGFELGKWDDRYLKPKELAPVWVWQKEKPLPVGITSLPVYMITNNEPDGSTYGISQASGMEYIINALNQSITYEDLSLVLQGLGIYVSTAAPPKDKRTGKPGKYQLHPGNVVEIGQDDTFQRVTGVSSIQPFQDHMKFLKESMYQGIGLPLMATGQVDVSTAMSGIALALEMSPIIAENEDKQLSIGGRWNHIGYDLINMWFPIYEATNTQGAQFESTFGDPMPINRDTFITELTTLYNANLILIEEVRDRLEQLGYENTDGIVDKLLNQKEKNTAAETGDPYAIRDTPKLSAALANRNGGKNGKVEVKK